MKLHSQYFPPSLIKKGIDTQSKILDQREMIMSEEDILQSPLQSMVIPALKGLVLLKNFHCRVQVRLIHSMNPGPKLSKNVSSTLEALYRYEMMLAMADRPSTLMELMNKGNYESLKLLSDNAISMCKSTCNHVTNNDKEAVTVSTHTGDSFIAMSKTVAVEPPTAMSTDDDAITEVDDDSDTVVDVSIYTIIYV